MPIFDLDSAEIHVDLIGDTSNPPIVLLHGATATFRLTWRRQIDVLMDKYFLIGPDLRGHGQSTNHLPELDLRQLADDVADVLDRLRLTRAHICGFSGGASTALFFALRHPEKVKSLVLVSNNFELDLARTEANYWNVERVKNKEPNWWAWLEKTHKVGAEQLLNWWATEDAIRPNFNPSDLAKVTAPTLVVGGDHDLIIPLSQTVGLFEHISNAQLAILPNCGHGAPWLKPQQFIALVRIFLQSQDEG